MRSELNFAATKYGFVYMGLEPMTDDDVQALREYTRQSDPKIDRLSTKGRWNRNWICRETSLQHMGGEGSETYESQMCGQGVHFKPRTGQEPIFHVDPEGNYVHGVVDYPRLGTSYHIDDYNSTVAGPRPDSEADTVLGDSTYVWDDDLALWTIV